MCKSQYRNKNNTKKQNNTAPQKKNTNPAVIITPIENNLEELPDKETKRRITNMVKLLKDN